MYEVSSEIYGETDFGSTKGDNGHLPLLHTEQAKVETSTQVAYQLSPLPDSNFVETATQERIISKFTFAYPQDTTSAPETDKDGDLIVARKTKGIVEIAHFHSTVLQLVGLQVWRGALLLADFLFHHRHEIKDKQILEIGAGVGLTSIAAAIYAKKVVCTDVDIGGILDLIRANVKQNRQLTKTDIEVLELDFNRPFSDEMVAIVEGTDIVIAADVIYDDDLTKSLVNVLANILDKRFSKPKTVYMALEKRYVFTIADFDTVAPCYEHFKRLIADKTWRLEDVAVNFPQYFEYERCKELILLKITN